MTNRFGTVTSYTAILIGAVSILSAILGPPWLDVIWLPERAMFEPSLVLRGQLWRLVTYPWFEMSPISLIFAIWATLIFMSTLEGMWGERRLLFRLAMLVALPVALLTLLAIPLGPLRDVSALGTWGLLTALVVAYASELPDQPILLFFVARISGDTLILVEGVILGLFVLFSGSVVMFLVPILSFALALAWFRFNLVRDLRRSWLRLRKRRVEARMAKLRRERSLRIVPLDGENDDDEDSDRVLH
jgi:membrane associated rhomboid family serine protease